MTRTRKMTRTRNASKMERKITAITIGVLQFDQDLAMRLARRPGGIDVVYGDKVAFRLVVPSTTLRS